MQLDEHRKQRAVTPLTGSVSRRRLPAATISVLVITSAVSIIGILYPVVLDTLRRDPGALLAGQWWRLLSPLLVQSDGWWQFASNGVALVVVGGAAERLFGSRRWFALYLAGGMAGELAGYAWQPHGAGNSVAVFGLVGGLSVLLFRGGARVPPITSLFIVYWVAAVAGYAAGGPGLAAGICVLFGVPTGVLLRRKGSERQLALYTGVIVLLGEFSLAILHDIHGPATIAGICAGLVTPLPGRQGGS